MTDADRTVITARLELRPITQADVTEVHAMMATPSLREYMADGRVTPIAIVEGWVDASDADFAERGLGLFVARPRGQAPIVGLTGFLRVYDPPVLELLYAVHPERQRQGLAVEMAAAMLGRGFSCGLDPIRASTDAPNLPSIRVLERLGMRRVGSTAATPWEQVHYAITRAEFERAGAAR